MGTVKTLPPDGLGSAGRKVWTQISSGYALRPDELATLEDACRITDMIDALDTVWAADGRPMTAKGSMGQLVIHPIIGEVRAQRMARNALWRQLKLPDLGDAGEQSGVEPNQHRAAAQSRWASAHGKAG